MINPRRILSLLMMCFIGVQANSPRATVTAGDLITSVAANELRDRLRQGKWTYAIEKRVGSQSFTEQQVETTHGSIYRVVAIDGVLLTASQQKEEDARIARFLGDTSQQAKLKQRQDEDEQKLENLMRIMPEAFLYEYDGVEGELVRLRFRPDPSYRPPTYEARVVHSLAGIILIDRRENRLAKFSGTVMNQVDFGFGFLGHIDKGGTIEVGRVPVGPTQWKTALIHIQLSGRVVFFKTVDKQEFETRSNFRAVPGDLSLAAARELLGR